MRLNKKIILSLFVTLSVLSAIGFTTHVYSKDKESKLPYYSKHIKFTEKTLQSDGNYLAVDYEAWINDVGEFRFNVVSGPLAGDYQVWDGIKYYQYSKSFNDLMIRDFYNDGDKGVPIPHEFLSEQARVAIVDGIKNQNLRKVEGRHYINKTDRGKMDFIINNENMVIQSSYEVDGRQVHEIVAPIVEQIDKFDKSLLSVDAKNAKLTYMK
ncbi:hypothetical protein [Paenibacillus sp. NPDC058174]|uniref:hypothetical protein n=1 Tax=Paenibacillus sp. NPDC058174 TaxID=3346366 RepID=UPI0036D7CC55